MREMPGGIGSNLESGGPLLLLPTPCLQKLQTIQPRCYQLGLHRLPQANVSFFSLLFLLSFPYLLILAQGVAYQATVRTNEFPIKVLSRILSFL